jgi:hypothetical protein
MQQLGILTSVIVVEVFAHQVSGSRLLSGIDSEGMLKGKSEL